MPRTEDGERRARAELESLLRHSEDERQAKARKSRVASDAIDDVELGRESPRALVECAGACSKA